MIKPAMALLKEISFSALMIDGNIKPQSHSEKLGEAIPTSIRRVSRQNREKTQGVFNDPPYHFTSSQV